VRAPDRPPRGPVIARNGLVEQVGDAIRERIIDQVLAPGERLNITALARQLGVSDTPVREALVRLQSERLLTFEPYIGYTVLPLPTPERLDELLDLRQLLEGYAARIGAPRVSSALLNRLRQALAGMEAVGAGPTFSESKEHVAHDHAFHIAIMQAADNSALLEVYQSLNLHMHLSRLYHGRGVAELERTRREHRRILEAYEAKDPVAAERAVLAHIEAARARQHARLQDLQKVRSAQRSPRF
jgi:DNA-binding GntR family transcriptional regulator